MTIGLDTNILCYALDSAYRENALCQDILLKLSSEFRVGINPTVLHETYHTLVFSQKWDPREAQRRLSMLLSHPCVDFYNQTKRVCSMALEIATRHNIGGRDSLIITNFLINRVSSLYTHDMDLLRLKEIKWKNLSLKFEDPTSQ